MPAYCFAYLSNIKNLNGHNCCMPVGRDNQVLKEEYHKAIETHPFKFIHAKFYLFWQMLHPRYWRNQKIPYDIYENPFGLKSNENFTVARDFLSNLAIDAGNSWYFVWVSGIHLLWLIINLIILSYYLIKGLIMKFDLRLIFRLRYSLYLLHIIFRI